ncbi:MAG: hypothetical protein MHM6MM_002185 [Cercozoa sp. M6MM]
MNRYPRRSRSRSRTRSVREDRRGDRREDRRGDRREDRRGSRRDSRHERDYYSSDSRDSRRDDRGRRNDSARDRPPPRREREGPRGGYGGGRYGGRGGFRGGQGGGFGRGGGLNFGGIERLASDYGIRIPDNGTNCFKIKLNPRARVNTASLAVKRVSGGAHSAVQDFRICARSLNRLLPREVRSNFRLASPAKVLYIGDALEDTISKTFEMKGVEYQATIEHLESALLGALAPQEFIVMAEAVLSSELREASLSTIKEGNHNSLVKLRDTWFSEKVNQDAPTFDFEFGGERLKANVWTGVEIKFLGANVSEGSVALSLRLNLRTVTNETLYEIRKKCGRALEEKLRDRKITAIAAHRFKQVFVNGIDGKHGTDVTFDKRGTEISHERYFSETYGRPIKSCSAMAYEERRDESRSYHPLCCLHPLSSQLFSAADQSRFDAMKAERQIMPKLKRVAIVWNAMCDVITRTGKVQTPLGRAFGLEVDRNALTVSTRQLREPVKLRTDGEEFLPSESRKSFRFKSDVDGQRLQVRLSLFFLGRGGREVEDVLKRQARDWNQGIKLEIDRMAECRASEVPALLKDASRRQEEHHVALCVLDRNRPDESTARDRGEVLSKLAVRDVVDNVDDLTADAINEAIRKSVHVQFIMKKSLVGRSSANVSTIAKAVCDQAIGKTGVATSDVRLPRSVTSLPLAGVDSVALKDGRRRVCVAVMFGRHHVRRLGFATELSEEDESHWVVQVLAKCAAFCNEGTRKAIVVFRGSSTKASDTGAHDREKEELKELVDGYLWINSQRSPPLLCKGPRAGRGSAGQYFVDCESDPDLAPLREEFYTVLPNTNPARFQFEQYNMDVRKDEVMQVAMAAMHMYVANRGGIKMPAPLHHASRWIKDDGTFSQVFKSDSTPIHGGVYCLSQTELSLRYGRSVLVSMDSPVFCFVPFSLTPESSVRSTTIMSDD